MKYLIDVNIALAALIAGHSEHGRAEKWLGGLAVSDEVLLCPLVELGFVRVALLGKYINEMATAKRLSLDLCRERRALSLCPMRAAPKICHHG